MKKYVDFLSIIILTHNDEDCISRCLNSLNKYIKLKSEIIIIDNNSKDKTKEILTNFKTNNNKFEITIVFNKKNLGIAKSRNQGLKICKGNYILILDSDTIMIDDSIYEGIDFLKSNKNIGIVFPKMFYADLTIQDNIRYFPTIKSKTKAVINIIKYKMMKRKIENVLDYNDMRNQKDIFEVDYGINAYMLIKKEVIKNVGIFDERIFYGPEDVDFCLRVHNYGYKVYYNSNINIVHERRRLSSKKIISKINFYHVQGLIYYFCKHKYLFKVKNNIVDD